MNNRLDQQVEFLHNIGKLLRFAQSSGYGLVLDNAHLDAKCEHGHHKPQMNDGLMLAFKLFRHTPDGRLDYFNLESDHNLLGTFWKSLDTRCEWIDRRYSMPWRVHEDTV